jgi:nicotinamidase/pyrazinamidase
MKRALIVVDVQNDFCPGGDLAVPEGDQIIPLINQLMDQFECVVATQDWHPKDHKSFASIHHKKPGEVILLNGLKQVLWPDHCIQGTYGAELVSGLDQTEIDQIIQKGTDPEIDSYSGFYDNGHRKATGLKDYLLKKGVKEVAVCGLAADYCVKYTALDAVDLGFKTTVIEDASRGINLKKGDVASAIREMRHHGVQVVKSEHL